MSDLNRFQRMFTREVTGKITERELHSEGRGDYPVTAYTIEQEDGTSYRGAMLGNYASPIVGDQVDMQIRRFGTLLRRKTYKYSEGRMERRRWKKIIWYDVLRDEVPVEVQEEVRYGPGTF